MKYFESKVTKCNECQHHVGNKCYHGNHAFKANSFCEKIYEQNCRELTPSCPMWQETKEQV